MDRGLVLRTSDRVIPTRVTDVAGSATVVAGMRYLGLGTLVGLNYDGASD